MKHTKRLLKKLFKVNLLSSALDAGFVIAALLYLFVLGRFLPENPTVSWVQENVVFLSVLFILAFTGIVALYAFAKRSILVKEYGLQVSFLRLLQNSFLAFVTLAVLIGVLTFLSLTPLLTLPFSILAFVVLLVTPTFLHVLHVTNSFSRSTTFLIEKYVVVIKSAFVLVCTVLGLFIPLTILQKLFTFVTGTQVGVTTYYVYNTLFTIYVIVAYLLIIQVHRRYVLMNRTKF
ncbi:hypothetical protein D6774_01240 [Candidatus Woesearchaeota archaeon]|nr:MAG: hypothetical protein D6774_01240 [Candidatus Woesearchaeota archaeon]